MVNGGVKGDGTELRWEDDIKLAGCGWVDTRAQARTGLTFPLKPHSPGIYHLFRAQLLLQYA
jgi:hypothetical protein